MVEVIIKRTTTVEETVDVAFPLFFTYSDESSGSHWEVHVRVARDGSSVSVTVTHNHCGGTEYEIEADHMSLSEAAYLHGQGRIYSHSTPMDFERALREARAAIDQSLAT